MTRRVISSLMMAACVFAQQGPIQQSSKDRCAVNVFGNNNRVFTCSGMDEKTANRILSLLNQIAATQGEQRDAIMAKLDEIQRGINDIRDVSAPRTISDADALRLRSQLLPFKGQKASLAFMATDNETAKLAMQIQEIFRAAQWDIPNGMSSMTVFAPGPLIGIEVAAKSITPAALAILNGLHAILPDVVGHLAPTSNDDTIRITVYSKR